MHILLSLSADSVNSQRDGLWWPAQRSAETRGNFPLTCNSSGSSLQVHAPWARVHLCLVLGGVAQTGPLDKIAGIVSPAACRLLQ